MNKWGMVVGVLIGLGLVTGVGAADLTVVRDGASDYVIAVGAEAEETRVMEAALLLRAALTEATGAELPIVKESEVGEGVPAIYLGRSAAARKAGLRPEELIGWSYRNRAVGKDIFLVGEDAPPRPAGTRVGYFGSLKAVTAFLEAHLGVRFVLPGPAGMHVPRRATLTVPAGLDESWSPRFKYISGASGSLWTNMGSSGYLYHRAYAVANCYLPSAEVVAMYGGHSYYTAVPEKEYGESHPEYFAMLGGIRQPKGNHLCISNPEVQELMLKEMERALDQGYQWVELAQTDGYQECGCAECQAIHPDRGEKLWIVHRKLAEELQESRPGKKVMILSYANTTYPPQTFDSFPDNVVIQLCRYGEYDFNHWAPFNVPATVYIYNCMPMDPHRFGPRYAVDLARRFIANDVQGVYFCGGFGRGARAWSLYAPSYYAFGKAAGDPDRNWDELVHEYVTSSFGEAAAPMRAFFSAMHKRAESYALIDQQRDYSFGGKAGDVLCHYYPPKVLTDMSSNLERALSLAQDEKVKARLALLEAEFKYLRSVASVYHLYRAYRIRPNWEALDLLAEQVREYQETLAWLLPEGKLRAAGGGLPAPFNGQRVRASGAPFSWDFALLREKQVLPGAGVQKLEVARTTPITLNGRLDKQPWADLPFHELNEIGMGHAPNPARFKVAYDDSYFYVGFEGLIAAEDFLDNLRPLGRDGQVWTQENMELVLDPFGTRERYGHFMFNPIPDSMFDRRFGYIEDPLHPLFDTFDRDWNGAWDYVAVIDRENKRWTAEVRIPYATLETDPPGPGSVWTMNVGRTERVAGAKSPILSLWSPNLESRSFHDRSTFGVVEFR